MNGGVSLKVLSFSHPCSEPTRHVFWAFCPARTFAEIHHCFLPILDMCERMTFEKPVQRLVSPLLSPVSFLLSPLPPLSSLPLSLAPSLFPLSAPPRRAAGKEERRLRLPSFGGFENDSVGIRGRRENAGLGGTPYPVSELAPLIWCLNIWCGKITHKISY